LRTYPGILPGFVAFSPDGRFVVCGGHGKGIAVFDAASGILFKELRGHAHPATRVAFLPDGRLVSGGEERMVKIWDPTAGTCPTRAVPFYV
jgi:transcription initiation factor TFIID subunit 5